MKLTSVIGLAVLLGVSAVAVAETEQRGLETTTASDPTTSSDPATASTRQFDELDADADGYLSKTEAEDTISDYDSADSNGDGQLDRAEFSAFEAEQSESATVPQ